MSHSSPAAAAAAVVLAIVALALGSLRFASAQDEILILIPDRVLDGRGGVVVGGRVIVLDGKIVADAPIVASPGVGAPLSGRRIDLAGTTLLPGLIDTHVHIDWSFDKHGRAPGPDSPDTEAERLLSAIDNARATLRAGVTTVQSLGSPLDLVLRDGIARGTIGGPRILTSIEPVTARTGDPRAIRELVRSLVERGADVIKVFASASIRDGGAPTLDQDQLDAACGEAKRLGRRAVVHAHGPESARRAVAAGCTSIEHGALLDRATLELMAARGVIYDPNIDLVLRNYLENREHFLGVGNYTEVGFAQMEAAVPKVLEAFQSALEVKGLDIVFGTDAVAGAHGRNVEELVYRIEQGGQDPGDAIVSATSRAALSLRLGDQLGAIEPGYRADLIAVSGNPLEDPRALLRVSFVMKGGEVVVAPP